MATKKTTSTKSALAQVSKEPRSIEFDGLMTKSEVNEYEGKQDEIWGVRRRLCLLTLTRSGHEMVDGVLSEREGIVTLMQLHDEIKAWREHVEFELSLADSALARLVVAGDEALARLSN